MPTRVQANTPYALGDPGTEVKSKAGKQRFFSPRPLRKAKDAKKTTSMRIRFNVLFFERAKPNWAPSPQKLDLISDEQSQFCGRVTVPPNFMMGPGVHEPA
jgi:hypothetical protein